MPQTSKTNKKLKIKIHKSKNTPNNNLINSIFNTFENRSE